jgi:hypothetical protein
MDEPIDTAAVAAHLKATQGLGSIDIPSAYHSNWLDNARAKFDLNWRPRTDIAKLIDAACFYKRPPTIHGRFGIRLTGDVCRWEGDPFERAKLVHPAIAVISS